MLSSQQQIIGRTLHWLWIRAVSMVMHNLKLGVHLRPVGAMMALYAQG